MKKINDSLPLICANLYDLCYFDNIDFKMTEINIPIYKESIAVGLLTFAEHIGYKNIDDYELIEYDNGYSMRFIKIEGFDDKGDVKYLIQLDIFIGMSGRIYGIEHKQNYYYMASGSTDSNNNDLYIREKELEFNIYIIL